MKNSFETTKFNRRYLLFGILFWLLFSAVVYIVFGEFGIKFRILTAACIVFEILVYIPAVLALRHMCREVAQATDIMVRLMEDDAIPSEPCMEGELGELYTSLYKLVGALRESKHKEQAEKLFLRDMMSDISHQLKTPLASLTVFVDLLYDDRVEEPEKRREILTESKNQIARMEWMVLSMLKLARIEAGAISFESTCYNLKPLLCRAAEGVTYLTRERCQNITVNCADDITLICDGDWLVEAIINLLKNASDYSPEKADIEIEAEKTAMYTRIYVRDNGMGIPEEALPHIFRRFYRVNKEVNPNSVGIGLPLTKSIVEGMGGSIAVRSRLGEYTHFIITFV